MNIDNASIVIWLKPYLKRLEVSHSNFCNFMFERRFFR